MTATANSSRTRPFGPLLRAAQGFQRAMDRFSEWLGIAALYLVPVLVLIGFGNVILRYVGELVGARLTTNEVIEAQWYVYGLIFLFALPYVLKHQINVRVDFWYTKQSLHRRAWIDLIGHFVGLIPFALLGVYISYPAARTSWRARETSPEGGLAYYPIKTLILVVMVILVLQALAEVVKLIIILRGHEELVEIEEHEEPLRIE
ncbi:MAG TPA: TRAP transporter small permease subunit [Acidimicrobiia bacterium]